MVMPSASTSARAELSGPAGIVAAIAGYVDHPARAVIAVVVEQAGGVIEGAADRRRSATRQGGAPQGDGKRARARQVFDHGPVDDGALHARPLDISNGNPAEDTCADCVNDLPAGQSRQIAGALQASFFFIDARRDIGGQHQLQIDRHLLCLCDHRGGESHYCRGSKNGGLCRFRHRLATDLQGNAGTAAERLGPVGRAVFDVDRKPIVFEAAGDPLKHLVAGLVLLER